MAKWNSFLDEEYSSSGREKTSRSRNKKKESKKRRRKRKEEKKKNVYNNVIDEMAFQTETRAEHDLPAEILEAEKKVFSLWVEGLNKEGK
ncbi:MAG: hypothetical protein NZ519_14040, partial [Bacteroidia bacterium]|nr:hypothetical protein [Bacteroidia bacterium]